GIPVDEYFGLLVLGAILGGAVGAVVGIWTGRPALAGVFSGVRGRGPHVIVDNARVQRFRALNRGLPYAIDLMALSMSAGLDFPGAIQQVVSKAKANQPLHDELTYILQQFQLGRTRAQVLKELGERVPLDVVKKFVNAMLQPEE